MIARCAARQPAHPPDVITDQTIAWLWLIDPPADALVYRHLRAAQRALISVKLG